MTKEGRSKLMWTLFKKKGNDLSFLGEDHDPQEYLLTSHILGSDYSFLNINPCDD